MDDVEMGLNSKILAFKWNIGLQNKLFMGLILYPSSIWGKSLLVGTYHLELFYSKPVRTLASNHDVWKDSSSYDVSF